MLLAIAAVLRLLIAAYVVASAARLAANPSDKLLPAPASFVADHPGHGARGRTSAPATSCSGRTRSPASRGWAGLGIAAVLGARARHRDRPLPLCRRHAEPFLAVVSMIPPLAVLPILFIILGLGEAAKVALIVIGIAPFMIRDLAFRVARDSTTSCCSRRRRSAPTSWQIVTRVALPLLLPRLIAAVRLALGPAWLFLIAAEAIASTEGLGYRIFLVRRYLAMDVILPYVAWITLLAFSSTGCSRALSRRLFPWAGAPA